MIIIYAVSSVRVDASYPLRIQHPTRGIVSVDPKHVSLAVLLWNGHSHRFIECFDHNQAH